MVVPGRLLREPQTLQGASFGPLITRTAGQRQSLFLAIGRGGVAAAPELHDGQLTEGVGLVDLVADVAAEGDGMAMQPTAVGQSPLSVRRVPRSWSVLAWPDRSPAWPAAVTARRAGFVRWRPRGRRRRAD